MASVSLNLISFCVLDKDSERAKFQFQLKKYSLLNHKRSKAFRFAGHHWKLQVVKKVEHFGMYLRWYGTNRSSNRAKNKLKCIASIKFSILNKLLPDDSISQGTRKDKNIYEKIGVGIGYSKIIKVEELESFPGYILGDSLFLQLYIKLHSTSYQDELLCGSETTEGFVKGTVFEFHNTNWYIVLFPEGEKVNDEEHDMLKNTSNEFNSPKTLIASFNREALENRFESKTNETEVLRKNELNGKKDFNRSSSEIMKNQGESNDKENENGKNVKTQKSITHASIYMMRDINKSNIQLRHDVKFMIIVDGGNHVALEQHFYGTDSNVFGTASFMTATQLKRLWKSSNLKITTKFLQTVPYVYFAYHINKTTLQDESTDFHFKDQNNFPWKFCFMRHSTTKEFLKAAIVLDDYRNDEQVKLFTAQRKVLMVSWFVEILSPIDIEKSITFFPRSKREIRECKFSSSGEKDMVTFPVTVQEVISDDSPFLDSDGALCVKLSILCSNFVEDISEVPDDIFLLSKKSTKEVNQTSQQETLGNIESDVDSDNDETTLSSLKDHIVAYEKNVNVHDPKVQSSKQSYVKTKNQELSIALLKKKSRPSAEDYKELIELAKDLENVIRTVPLNISTILYAGGLGQTTMVTNHYQLDFIIFLKDYDDYAKSFKVVLSVLQERIKEHCIEDDSKDDDIIPPTLPKALHFFHTSKGLLFQLGEVNVTMLMSRPIEAFGGYKLMYERASKANKMSISIYNVLASERQVEFIRNQDEACKDLICVVKAWINQVIWTDVTSRPSSYLVSLILIYAYERVKKLNIMNTPSFDKEVLLEFGRLTSDKELHIEWNAFYDPKDYPILSDNEMFASQPVVRDPAMPYHNVCHTGIENWNQFRAETEKWLLSLTY